MASADQTVLQFVPLSTSLSAKVHSLVVFNICDCFVRRPDQADRVIGTLLGSVLPDGTVDVRNSYVVPHNESSDQVALDIDYHHNMLSSHQKVNPKEVIVGWFSTGLGVTGGSALIHEFYSREVANPVHLIVDTGFTNGEASIKAFVSVNLSLGDQQVAVQFQEIALDLPERVGFEILKNTSVDKVPSDMEGMEATMGRLLALIDDNYKCVDDVVEGRVAPDNTVGRFISETVSSVPKISPPAFDKLVNDSLHDQLLLLYLSSITRSQLGISKVLGSSSSKKPPEPHLSVHVSSSSVVSEASRTLQNSDASLASRGTVNITSIETLPEEALFNILMRLSARKVGQVRSVQKLWRAVSSEPTFLAAHLQHAIHQNLQGCEVVLVFARWFDFAYNVPTAHLARSPHLEIPRFLNVPSDPEYIKYGPVIVVGSVDGLVCIRFGESPGSLISLATRIGPLEESDMLYLWNPSRVKFLEVPGPLALYYDYAFGSPRFNHEISVEYQFGYDPISKDYKIVKLSFAYGASKYVEWLRVAVYCLRARSWHYTYPQTPHHLVSIHSPAAFNPYGHVHWLADIDTETAQDAIVAFDLEHDTLSIVTLPNPIRQHDIRAVSALDGKLCVVSSVSHGLCNVWKMDTYGDASSWIEDADFSDKFSASISPYGFTSSRKFIYRDEEHRFALYDPVEATYRIFTSDDVHGENSSTAVVEYVDNLVEELGG